MDFLSSNFIELSQYVFDANQRLYWGYLLSALFLAVGVYFFGRARLITSENTPAEPIAEHTAESKEALPAKPSLLSFLFPKEVFLAKSACNDYLLFVSNKFIKAALFPAIIITMVPVALAVSDGFEWAFGTIEPLSTSSAVITLVFTLLLFVFDDFTRFFLHYLLHKIPFLWEFHKVHHSATVLTPMTVYRSHPVENYLYACRMALTQGFVVGLCYFLFGPTLKMIDIVGANLFVFAFNVLGSNLRHSHIWLSWGNRIEKIFLSPAQHQIHHSTSVKHFDKNFGTALALWDRLFSSLILASTVSKLTFGIGKEGRLHSNIMAIYLQPFKQVVKMMITVFASKENESNIGEKHSKNKG